MTIPSCLAAIGLALTAALPAAALAVGDVAQGWVLAEQWCAACHAIGGTAVLADTPPAFEVIVGERGRDADWIAAWLVAPHPNMPDLSLTGAEIDALIAYMESLRPAD